MMPKMIGSRNKRPSMQIEIRAVIHFLWLKRYRNTDILSQLEDVYCQGVMTLKTVERWTKAFLEERTTLNDSPTPGWPSRNDVTDAVKQIIHDDRFFSQNRTAQRLIAHRDVLRRILIPELGLGKLNFRWIWHKRTTDQKPARVTISRQLLTFLDGCSEQ
jgi:hypothetical protein